MVKITIVSTPSSYGVMEEVFDILKDPQPIVGEDMVKDLVMYGQSFGVYTDGKYKRIPLKSVYKIEEET